jgi:hypothetical protein
MQSNHISPESRCGATSFIQIFECCHDVRQVLRIAQGSKWVQLSCNAMVCIVCWLQSRHLRYSPHLLHQTRRRRMHKRVLTVIVPIEPCLALGGRSQEIGPCYRVRRSMPSSLLRILSRPSKQQPICCLPAHASKSKMHRTTYARHQTAMRAMMMMGAKGGGRQE